MRHRAYKTTLGYINFAEQIEDLYRRARELVAGRPVEVGGLTGYDASTDLI